MRRDGWLLPAVAVYTAAFTLALLLTQLPLGGPP